MKRVAVMILLASLPAQALPPDGRHDFDFEIGVWKTHIARLAHPLRGSRQWLTYDGTSVVRKVWGGKANLVELEVTGAGGRIEGLSLRLYNPATRQWSLNYAGSGDGVLGVPTVGAFQDGRGVFYDRETIGGRQILVRNVWTHLGTRQGRFEQAFSADDGKSWEVNWIATDTRLR